MATLFEQTKTALRLKTDDEGVAEELLSLIISAIADLAATAGVDVGDLNPYSEGITASEKDALLMMAVKTYVRMHFGQPDDYDRLVKSYDDQKAMLRTAFQKEV